MESNVKFRIQRTLYTEFQKTNQNQSKNLQNALFQNNNTWLTLLCDKYNTCVNLFSPHFTRA